MSEKNGGAAFPVYPRIQGANSIEVQDATGMSLRDYFAAKALVALIAEPKWFDDQTPVVDNVTDGEEWESVIDRFAVASYRIADAMLRAREVKP